MGLLSAISDSLDGLLSRSSGPPSYFGSQSSTIAGPTYLDAFQAKRAPAGWELVEQYKSLIFACVQINALGVSRVPLRLMTDRTKGRGGKPSEVSKPRSIRRGQYSHLCRSGYLARTTATYQDVQEITEHPLLACLDQPDPDGYFSRQDLIGLMSAYCDVVGVGYCKIDSPWPSMPPRYLWPMQAQYVQDLKRPGDPRIERYSYFAANYRADELLRFRPPSLSLRDPYGRGYSPTYSALQYAMLEDKYVAIQDQLLGQGPRPELLVTAKDAMMPLGEEERRRYAQDLIRMHSRSNAGRVVVTNGAVDVKPLSYSPTDLSGMQLSEYDLERVCNVFGVPVSYFSKETNLANLQAAESQHARTAIEPRCQSIAGTLTRLVQRYDPTLFFAFDPAVEEDKEREAKIVDLGLKSGRITINEANIDSPWGPKDWGDEPWLPGTLKQPTMISESHGQGLEQIKAGMEQAKNATADDDTPARSALAAGDRDRSEDQSDSEVGSRSGRLDAILNDMERRLGL